MISLIGGGLLFIACFYMGLGLRRYYRIRKDLIMDFCVFLENIESKIRFLNVPVPDLISEGKTVCKAEFKNILSVVEKNLTIKEEKEKIKSVYLLEKTNEIMENFFSTLGTTDLTTQLASIESAKSSALIELTKAEKDMVSKGTLSYKLAVLLGIALLIIVV